MNTYELWLEVNGGEYTTPIRFKANEVKEIGAIYNEERRVTEYHLVIDGKLFIFAEDYFLQE